MCEKPPEEKQRKPHRAGLDKTRKREARFLPSAYFEEITISPDFQKNPTICTSKYPSLCLSVLQALDPPSSLFPVHLTVIPQCNLCQSRQGGVGEATRHGIGTRCQKMPNPLWQVFGDFFVQLSLGWGFGNNLRDLNAIVTYKDWIYKRCMNVWAGNECHTSFLLNFSGN